MLIRQKGEVVLLFDGSMLRENILVCGDALTGLVAFQNIWLPYSET
jgi:hypothetical protein